MVKLSILKIQEFKQSWVSNTSLMMRNGYNISCEFHRKGIYNGSNILRAAELLLERKTQTRVLHSFSSIPPGAEVTGSG